jgi:ketosteroid isomerase-like protein
MSWSNYPSAVHPNEELLRREYEAFARGDREALEGIFADGITYHIPGRNPSSGTYRGKEEVFALFARDRDVAFESELHDVIANDSHAIALSSIKAEAGGLVYEDLSVHVVHVIDGRIAEAWFFPGDQYAADELWSRASLS